MDIANLDFFLYISLIFVCYVILLLTLKKIGFWRKIYYEGCANSCPSCQHPLERIRRQQKDYVINYLTFQIFDFKRYKCLDCSWEGRRWDRPFSGKF